MLAASSEWSLRKTPFLPAFCRCVLADRMAHSWFSGTWDLSSSLSAPKQWIYILLPPKRRWWQQIPKRVPKGWVSISTVTAKQVRSFIKQQGCRAGEVGQRVRPLARKWGPEFNPQNPSRKAGHSRALLKPHRWRGRAGRRPLLTDQLVFGGLGFT